MTLFCLSIEILKIFNLHLKTTYYIIMTLGMFMDSSGQQWSIKHVLVTQVKTSRFSNKRKRKNL